MFEKVNPSHPDKIADRIAGAIVDLAYLRARDPKIAVEVLIGHGTCNIIVESSVYEVLTVSAIKNIVWRIAGPIEDKKLNVIIEPQDSRLNKNQEGIIRCGDNGIFKGVPVTAEQNDLTAIAKQIYARYPTDGKYILNVEAPYDQLIICQSCCVGKELSRYYYGAKVNPIGDWTGGPNVDSGATNRKLGSDMGDSITGGGLHGKDLSKADVSVNIYAWLKAQLTGKPVELCCAIGDETIDGRPYSEIVEVARTYIDSLGGFEKFAEWGLIR